ncbi:hypothetical protein LSCM1_02358 [Leishmania martiniquensis]|uniref:Leucine-rich repeat protein n=1 Tax=Leishmania martiniquensis TaxID=1580590 RepID=A0A836GR08_9TRYP|nr:hypothetical protein LSCM1_02358 [Leishmania martiniquensis]
MEAFRSVRLTCHTSLAPSIAKEEKGQVLRVFNAPRRSAELEVSNPVLCAHRSVAVRKQQHLFPIDFDPLLYIKKMTTEMLTNREAERIAYPMHTHPTSFEQLLTALMEKLQHTVQAVSWNHPQKRPEWDSDLRFYGPWWLVVHSERQLKGSCGLPLSILGRRASSCTTATVKYSPEALLTRDLLFNVHEGKPENQYAPLLVERTFESENQLFADIAERLGGKTFQLSLFHISGVFVGPDRMQVLIFEGFRRLCAAVEVGRAAGSAMQQDFVDGGDGLLSTLSFSSCHIGSAGLLILLVGIVFLSMHHDCHVHSLDLSYNDLTKSSLWCLTQLMSYTKIRRLSLRGNFLCSNDAFTLREFLLEGCDREVEELDLSYTSLSAEQVRVLIDCLPHLSNLRVLLLEEVAIPSAHWAAFARVVEHMQLWRVELFTEPPSSIMAGYARAMQDICRRNRQRSRDGSSSDQVARWGASTFFGIKDSSFFRAFFHLSRLRGGLASGRATTALPDGYGAFTNNDPSLQLLDA